MPFFQNPFDAEFRGHLVLGDRQHIPTFSVKANRNRSDLIVAWNNEPYDLSVDSDLTISFAYDPDFKNFGTITIDVSAGAMNSSAVTAAEVVAALNADGTFNEIFTASVHGGFPGTVLIRSQRDRTAIKTYMANSGAEKKLKFNRWAGVEEIPTYFERHTIGNRFAFPDSLGMLVLLDTGDPIDQQIITDAGLDYTTELADYQLLRGRSSLFNFQVFTVDGDDRITQIIEYPAGAKTGDLGRKIVYTYTDSNKSPDTIAEMPYTLQDGDILTP